MLKLSSKKLQVRHLPGEVSITKKQKFFLIIDTTKNQRYLALAQSSSKQDIIKEPLKNVVSSRNLHTSSEKRELATKTYQEKIRRGAMNVLPAYRTGRQPKCANCSSKHVFQRFLKSMTWTTDRARDDQIATKLQTLMKRRKWEDITGIVVNAGPGPFTSVRTGVAVANALAYSLKIPVFPMKGGISKNQKERVTPIYDKPPNITWPKVAIKGKNAQRK